MTDHHLPAHAGRMDMIPLTPVRPVSLGVHKHWLDLRVTRKQREFCVLQGDLPQVYRQIRQDISVREEDLATYVLGCVQARRENEKAFYFDVGGPKGRFFLHGRPEATTFAQAFSVHGTVEEARTAGLAWKEQTAQRLALFQLVALGRQSVALTYAEPVVLPPPRHFKGGSCKRN